MKSLFFQLAYQAASTVLLLFYANRYQLEQQQHDQGRKQHVMNNVSARDDNDGERNASSYITLKAT